MINNSEDSKSQCIVQNESEKAACGNVRKNLPLIYLLKAIPFMYLSFFLPLFSKELGMDSVQIAGLYSVLSLIVLLIRPFIGRICDKIGRKPMLLFALVLYILSFISYSMVSNVTVMYVSRIIQAVASPVMGIALYCIIIDTHKDNLAETFGRLGASSTRGSILGVAIAILLFTAVDSYISGWKAFMYACCLIYVFIFIYSFINIKETRKIAHDTAVDKHVKLSAPLKKLMIIEFILACFSGAIGAIFIIYLQDKFSSADIATIGYAYMIPVVASSIYSKRIGRFADKLGMMKAMFIGLILDSIFILIFPSFKTLLISAAFYCLSGMSSTLYSTASNAFFAKETGITNRGTIVGTYTTITGLGGVIGPMAGGILYKNISIAAPFYYCAIGELICALLVLCLLTNKKSKNSVNEL